MATIDADAHVIETDETWDYMEGSERAFRPLPLISKNAEGAPREFWQIDGRLRSRRTNIGSDTSESTREMADIEARLRHMDDLQVDIQVLYPSLFLVPLTTRPEVELALCNSYNRWLADICAKGKGRLRWAMLPTLMSIDHAVKQLEWAKDHGACAVFMRGIEGDKRLSDPYFFPLYEAASSLDMPIGVHAATGNFAFHDFYATEAGFAQFKLPVVGAFHSLVFCDVPAQFPKLRFGFIEVSSQWVPYVLHDLASRFRRRGKELPKNLLKTNRMYVACQTDDDLPYVLEYAGEDNLLIGSDYGHADVASELQALRNLRERGKVPAAAIGKILDMNPRTFYAL